MPRGAPGGLVAIRNYTYRIVFTYYDLDKNRQVWGAKPFTMENKPITNFEEVEEIGKRISKELTESETFHDDFCLVVHELLEEIQVGLTVRT